MGWRSVHGVNSFRRDAGGGGSRGGPSRAEPAPRRWEPLPGAASNVFPRTGFREAGAHPPAAPRPLNDLLLRAACADRLPAGCGDGNLPATDLPKGWERDPGRLRRSSSDCPKCHIWHSP